MVVIEWVSRVLGLLWMKIERDVNSRERIAKKKFRVSIVVNNLKILTTQRYLKGSIMK